MNKYIYFVSFLAYKDLQLHAGNIEVTCTTEITSILNIHFIEGELQSKKLINVVIINYILLRTE